MKYLFGLTAMVSVFTGVISHMAGDVGSAIFFACVAIVFMQASIFENMRERTDEQ